MTEHPPTIREATDGELFRLLVENVRDYAIFVLDSAGRVRSWNPGAEHLLGYSEAEILGQPVAVFFTPEDVQNGEPEREMRTALETGRGEDDRWHVRKDGRRFWVGGSMTPLWDEGHTLRGFAKILRDRTAWKQSEAALKHALAYTHGVVDTVREPLLVLGGDLRVRTANRSFYQTFQTSAAETEGRPIYHLGDGLWDIPRLRTLLEEVLPRDTSFDGFEVEQEFGTGRKVMLLNARRFRQDGEQVELILLAIEDITARRLAEEELRERETRFTALVKTIRDHAILTTDPDGRITSWNVEAEHILGYPEAEVLGRPFAMIFTPEDVRDVVPEKELAKARAGGRAEDERWHVRKGGERFWAMGIVTPTHDPDGRHTGFSKILRDRTEQKLAKTSLQQAHGDLEAQVRERTAELRGANQGLQTEIAERRGAEETARRAADLLRAVAEGTTDAVFVKDRAGHYLLFNEAAGRFVGRPPGEVIGKDDTDLFDPDSARRVMDRDRRLMEAGLTETAEEVLTAAGVTRTYQATKAPYRDAAGAVVGLIGVSRDITEKRLLAAERDAVLALLNLQIDRMPLAYLLSGPDFRYTRWNPAAERIFGHAEAEVLGKSPFEVIVPPESRPLVANIFERLKAGDMNAHGVSSNLTKDGRTITCEWLNTPLFEADGRFAGILCLAQDVTERRRLEEGLRLFRALIDQTMDGIEVIDADTGRFLDVNEKACTAHGYTRDEYLALGVRDIDPLVGARSWQEFLADRRPAGPQIAESLHRRKDGSTFPVEVNMNFIRLDRDYLVAVVRDITDRRVAEQALRLRDRAMQSVTQGIVITDPGRPDNPIVYASPSFLRLTGYGNDEVLGQNCRFLQGHETDPDAVARVREAVRQVQPCTVEFLNYRKDGSTFWNELSVAPVTDADGRLTNFIGVQTDVTERHQLEDQFRQAQKMEAFGQLAGGVAHDFNNLLSVISGYSALMLDDLRPNDEHRDMVQEIHNAGERAALLTRQLLAFSRKEVVQFQVLDLNGVVAGSEKMLGRLIGEDVSLTTALWPGLDRVKVDPGQIEQVIMNLVVNARDAMPQGGRITIETSTVDLDATYGQSHAAVEPGRYVLLAVSDTGSGMTAEVQRHIFEPFFTTKEVGKGTGLGLATVFGIVKQSGGHVRVYSEVGVGTSFKIYLPAVADVAPAVQKKDGPAADLSGTETILLVEDERAVRAMTRLALEAQGYTLLEAADGADAIHICEGHPGPIHLLVSDVVMPRMGGGQLAARLKALRPEMRVLFVSGYTDDAVVRHGVLQAEVAFLQKPFSLGALHRKVRAVLDGPG